jgi:catechol 2,3-dioxygenase-like lactoylglutathione lyase family enzyme
MIHLDHLTIFVADVARSREWYTQHIGLKLEFEIPGANAAALQDDGGLTLFVAQPQKLFWGYGAELRDPDGYLIRLWDEISMREKG